MVRPAEVSPGQHGHVRNDSPPPKITLPEYVWLPASRQRGRCELWLAGWLAAVAQTGNVFSLIRSLFQSHYLTLNLVAQTPESQ